MTSPKLPRDPEPRSPQTQPPPTQAPRTLLGAVTEVAQKIQAKVNFGQLNLKPNARVPEIWVHEAHVDKAEAYPLLGDRYLLGRSSQCDIVVPTTVVSKIHLSLTRDSRDRLPNFVLRDENSTNGVYIGKRRIRKLALQHGDILTLGPPDLADAVRIQFHSPPPWYVRTFRWSLYGVTAACAIGAVWVLSEWQKFAVRPLPRSVTGPVVVYSRDGKQPLREPYNTTHSENRRLSDFGRYLPKAVIASEDSRFYWHLGIDPIGVARAALTNFRGGAIREGASTLTQQLSRSLYRDYVGTADSAGRKVREAVVALKLETFYSKNELLLTYLNQVFLGIDLYGFEDAAKFYFGKSAKDLTLSEAATLAGILPAPNRFNPIQNYDLAVQYRDRVINRMRSLGMISQEEADRARRSRIEINPRAREILESTIAPYFYDYVFVELERLLGSELAREGNFIVETGLDPQMQARAEATLQDYIQVEGSQYGFSQGSIVSLDFRNGEIITMVGGFDYQESQFNRATQAQRQPGSTFKVFAYAAALEDGIPAGAAFSCAPMAWQGQSYGGCERSRGSIDMYRGLALSENVIALRVARETGLDRVVETARKLGVESELNPVPGLVLGQSEVNVLEMTGAYGIVANAGKWNAAHAVRRILDSSDCSDRNDFRTCRTIYDYAEDEPIDRPVMSPNVAAMMTDMLGGVVENGTGGNAYLGLGEVGKTGTTDYAVDLWFIGYVPSRSIVTGVWLGNDDNSRTYGSSGNAAQLWRDYMRQTLR
ncbi:MAG: transglycosylase domain-containing protein [Cyanobacteria bacterium SID2]|nr:transglycosylase domain-containing protein [Cyanobacteria bacterium SID2]